MAKSDIAIISRIQEAIDAYGDWQNIDIASPRAIHIAVTNEPYLSFMFDGSKTVESRFGLKRLAPYGKARVGDIVFLKNGPIVGYFTISWVKDFHLADHPTALIKEGFADAIRGNELFWKQKSEKRYATLLGIANLHQLTPIEVPKHDRRAWITLHLGQ